MKILIVVLFLCTSAFAEVTEVTCELRKIPGQKFSFRMQNLGQQGMKFLNSDPSDGYSDVFQTRSRNVTVKTLVSCLNGQGGDLRIGDDRIVFFGDSAGVDLAYLNLFKSSDFKAGYVRTEFDFGNDQDYSEVSCSHRKL